MPNERAKERQILRGMRRYADSIQQEQAAKTRAETRRLFELGPQAAAVELDRHCPHCQNLLTPNFVTIPAVEDLPERLLMAWNVCNCPQSMVAAGELTKQKEAADLQARFELYQKRLTNAGLVGWLANATFGSFKPRDDFKDAAAIKTQVINYTDKLLSGELTQDEHFTVTGEQTLADAIANWQQKCVRQNWLILHGWFGMGKSHLAASIVRAALDNGWRDVYFRVWPDYIERLKQAKFNDNYDEDELTIIRELRDGKLVVIDDLDKDKSSDWVRGVLYKALNHRYNAGLPTVLTFNCSPTDVDEKAPGRLALEEFMGKAVIDRFIEVSYYTIGFNGPSYRSGLTK